MARVPGKITKKKASRMIITVFRRGPLIVMGRAAKKCPVAVFRHNGGKLNREEALEGHNLTL